MNLVQRIVVVIGLASMCVAGAYPPKTITILIAE